MLCFAAFRGVKAKPLEELGLPAKGRVGSQPSRSRWHGKGFTEALAAVPPKKPVPKQRAVLPASLLNLADFLAPKPTSFAKKHRIW